MTNRSTRIRSGKKRGIRLVDLEFQGGIQEKENIENGRRPHGGYNGSKKHPLSPYTHNRDPTYLQEIHAEVGRSQIEKFAAGHRSPNWAINTSRESNHSGESPLFVHGLLSSSKYDKEGQHLQEPRPRSSVRGRSAPPKRSGTLYYRPNTTHQYLSATELHQTSQSSDATSIKYGRPTRTTLLRARQRSNSAPVNAYMQRRESAKKMESTQYSAMPTPREYIPARKKEESTHAFLTGARYNRAHLLDSKGLSVYGVYMPRKNPMACFMTGAASSRLKETVEEVPAPPDTPRSEVSDTHDHTSKPEYNARPSTAPGKRLLSGKMVTPRDRPKSAWGDAATSCDIIQNESSRVLVSFRSSKQSLRASESTLPSVTGISVPKVIFKRLRDPVEEMSLVNQPPPTPIGGLSVVESERVRKASISVRDSSTTGRMEDSNGPVIKKHINVELIDQSLELQTEDVGVEERQEENKNIEQSVHTDSKINLTEEKSENKVLDIDNSDGNGLKVFMTENNDTNKISDNNDSLQRTESTVDPEVVSSTDNVGVEVRKLKGDEFERDTNVQEISSGGVNDGEKTVSSQGEPDVE
ncbi:uncharacterized protein LOC110467439 isoform X2 [Mizuhopecten yessoensis]|uniref:uncharacterized protein LOC110467439 isoform X2 n=1 Tax=Mizuhopecten yessoensis TaxID=6573 RepID=UPI000B45A6D1|nr:uncharacterized protein LOC110467439 isoform X2 [Mizuhopecten yessoensis]